MLEKYLSTQSTKLEVVKSEIDGILEKHLTRCIPLQINQQFGFDLDNAKKILVDAAKVNPDLVIALDNTEGQQVIKSNDDDLTSVSERDFISKLSMGMNSMYLILF